MPNPTIDKFQVDNTTYDFIDSTARSTASAAVPQTRTVNSKALSSDIEIDSGDIEYDGTETYSSGTIGAEVSELKTAITTDTLVPIFTAWEQGSIDYQTGAETSSTTACRTVGYFQPDADTTLTITNSGNQTLGLRMYKANGDYLSGTNLTALSSIVLKSGRKYRLADLSTGNPNSVTAKFEIPNKNSFPAVYKELETQKIVDIDRLPFLDSAKNLYNSSTLNNGVVLNNGTISATSGYFYTDYIPIIGEQTAYWTYISSTGTQQVQFYDKNKTFMRKAQDIQTTHSDKGYTECVAPAGAAYFTVNVTTAYKDKTFVYVEDGYSEAYNDNDTHIYLKPEYAFGAKEYVVGGVGSDFTSFSAMCEALKNDKSEKIVYVKTGTYDIFTEIGGADFIQTIDDPTNTDWRTVNPIVPPNTTVIGIGDVTLQFTPTDTQIIDADHAFLFSPLNLTGSCHIENISVVASNCRYAVHCESAGNKDGDAAIITLKNVRATRTKGSLNVGRQCYASGIGVNAKWTFEDCIFTNDANNIWSVHTNAPDTLGSASVYLKDCVFKRSDGTHTENAITFQSAYLPQAIHNFAYIDNCYADGKIATEVSITNRQAFDVAVLNGKYNGLNEDVDATSGYSVNVYGAELLS